MSVLEKFDPATFNTVATAAGVELGDSTEIAGRGRIVKASVPDVVPSVTFARASFSAEAPAFVHRNHQFGYVLLGASELFRQNLHALPYVAQAFGIGGEAQRQ